MTIRVATVLSAREWESSLVQHAQETASLRIVLRAFQPSDIENHADEIDVVVAGGDVAWVTPRQISTWCRLGFGVVGIYPEGDEPAASMLTHGGAHEVVPDSIDTAALVQAVRFTAPARTAPAPSKRGTITVVAGARGAPGCTELALAIALNRAADASVVLIDADLDAPSIAVRLGLPPRPDLTDAADAVRAEGEIDDRCLHAVASVSVITGSHRPEEQPLRDVMITGVVQAATARFDEVYMDVGTVGENSDFVREADSAILVVDASAVGIVRAAQLAARWMGPQPSIVVNRVPAGETDHVVEATRRWLGLDPVAVVPEMKRVRKVTTTARLPDRKFARAVSQVHA